MFDYQNNDFDSWCENMKMHVLFEIIDKKEHDKFTYVMNNFNIEECINKIYKGCTLLIYARLCNNYIAFESLLNHPKINLYVKDNHGENILYTLVNKIYMIEYNVYNVYKLFMLCIDKMDTTKIDTNFKSARGRNLLHLASARTNPNFLKVLLTLPCSYNLYLEDKESHIPLQIALRKGNIETFKVIYELWDNTYDINMYLPLHCAVYGGIDMVKFVLNLNNIDINKRDKHGRIAFYGACYGTNNIDIMELFLKDDRMDINLADYNDVTAFRFICRSGSNDKFKMMLNYSKIRYIDLNKTDKNGETLFNLVVSSYNIERIKLLLEFNDNIDYNLRDINDIGPFYLACWNDKVRAYLCNDDNENFRNTLEEFKERHTQTVKLLLNDDRIDKSDIDKVYQIFKDNKIEYMIKILDDYLNHK